MNRIGNKEVCGVRVETFCEMCKGRGKIRNPEWKCWKEKRDLRLETQGEPELDIVCPANCNKGTLFTTVPFDSFRTAATKTLLDTSLIREEEIRSIRDEIAGLIEAVERVIKKTADALPGISFASFKDVVERLKIIEEIHRNEAYKSVDLESFQELVKRVEKIEKFLKEECPSAMVE